MGGQNNTGSARVEILKLLQSRAILRRVVDKTATGVGLSNDPSSRAKQQDSAPRRIARNQTLSKFLLPSTSQQLHPVRRQSAKRTQRLLAASKAKTTFFFLSLRSDVETSLDKNLAVSLFFFPFTFYDVSHLADKCSGSEKKGATTPFSAQNLLLCVVLFFSFVVYCASLRVVALRQRFRLPATKDTRKL